MFKPFGLGSEVGTGIGKMGQLVEILLKMAVLFVNGSSCLSFLGHRIVICFFTLFFHKGHCF